MNLLALETSSATGSVALASAAGVGERLIASPREQTGRLLPLIRELCSEAGLGLGEIDAIVFGRGPGSFTGLRVAAAITQGLAMALTLPVVGVSSLACLAQRAAREHGVERALVVVDARMSEVYWAEHVIERGLARLVGREHIAPPDAVPALEGPPWAAVGDAFARHTAALAPVTAAAATALPDLTPSARDLIDLAAPDLAAGRTLSPEAALPVYLREADAWHRTP